MSVRATVLYDVPGPNGRRTNRILTGISPVSYTHLTLPTTERV